jgi:hypothetical protein
MLKLDFSIESSKDRAEYIKTYMDTKSNYTQKELETIISQQEQERQKEQKKQQRRQRLLSNRSKKVQALAKAGIDPTTITAKNIDKIKLKDLDNITREKYPFLFPSGKFDFDKVYTLKNDERLYLAFRDFSGETTLEEILSQFAHLSNGALLDRLEVLAHMPPTYNRAAKSGRPGAAGDYRMTWGKQNIITEFQAETYNKNRRKSKKHAGQYKGFQVLKDGRRNSFSEVTPRSMLIIMNAFMSHITEQDRLTFYADMYARIKNHMPDFAELLPKPL